MLQRIHVLLSLVLGVILMLSAASGLVLSGNTLVEHLQATPGKGEAVAVVAERIARKLPGIERIERAPSGELRVAFSTATDSDVVLVDPASAAVIAPYQPSAVLSWVRDLHRELLLGSAGRWLSGLSALALLVLALTGSWLLARRLGGWRQLLLPINPGQGLTHWHSVVARWALLGLLILATSGIYLAASSQGWISDGQDADLAYPRGRLCGAGGGAGQPLGPAPSGPERSARAGVSQRHSVGQLLQPCALRPARVSSMPAAASGSAISPMVSPAVCMKPSMNCTPAPTRHCGR